MHRANAVSVTHVTALKPRETAFAKPHRTAQT
jgi:hypothetical protein